MKANRQRLKTLAKSWGEWEERKPSKEEAAPFGLSPDFCYLNNRYHVQVYMVQTEWGMMAQMTIGRHGDLAPITWDELQRIKDELAGEDETAVEVYPAAENLVNKANLRHLWILPDGFALPFGLHLPNAWGKESVHA